jgi:hypothetical protein
VNIWKGLPVGWVVKPVFLKKNPVYGDDWKSFHFIPGQVVDIPRWARFITVGTPLKIR